MGRTSGGMATAAAAHLTPELRCCRLIRIDGQTPQTKRPELVKKFQEDDDIRVGKDCCCC